MIEFVELLERLMEAKFNHLTAVGGSDCRITTENLVAARNEAIAAAEILDARIRGEI